MRLYFPKTCGQNDCKHNPKTGEGDISTASVLIWVSKTVSFNADNNDNAAQDDSYEESKSYSLAKWNQER